MQRIISAAGIEIDTAGVPELCCEVRGHRQVLNEIGGANPTCPDVLAEWPELVLVIESKFTEHLGHCGQIELRRRGGRVEIKPRACTGNHTPGSDIRTENTAACRLTIAENEGRRGYRSPRRYWEVGARLFKPEIIAPPRSPCPFAAGSYQLMRNLCFAAAMAQEKKPHKGYAFVLAFVASAPGSAETEADFAAFRAMLLPNAASRVGAISHEAIADVLRTHREGELADWIDQRVGEGLLAKAIATR